MRRFVIAAAMAASVLGVSACNNGYDGTPLPTEPTPVPVNAITIDVVGINGAQSFSPNPATVPDGQMVVWHNVDSVTHRVVLNSGALDTGNIAPGGFSAPMALSAAAPYHCSIHPSMVGTIVR